MINTVFLSEHSDKGSKSFSRLLKIPSVLSQKLSLSERKQIHSEVTSQNRVFENFSIKSGRVYLNSTNYIFSMEHVPGNVDIVLPKAKKMLDWIVLWYDQDRTIHDVSFDNHSKIKIYGNGSRIMGLDEPLICDMPFMSLRLTYISDADGWVVT